MMHPMFEHFLLSLVLVNTLCMAIEYEGMSQTYIDVLEMFNTVFTYMFMMEFLTKVCLRPMPNTNPYPSPNPNPNQGIGARA